MVNRVNVYRAQPLGDRVPDMCIATNGVMPDSTAKGTATLEEGMTIFKRQAKELADALYASLPGGTLDQLLREMLERKASQFVVRF